ncbi:Cytochrome c-type biogenesis protein CcmI [Methylophilaceae bacterium]
MLAFLLLVVVLLVVVVGVMVRPLFWPNASMNADAFQEKRAVYRQQFDELMEDKNNGMLDGLQYDLAKTELERRMLSELDETNAVGLKPKADRKLAFSLILIVPIAAIYLYLVIGRPIAIVFPDMQAAMVQASAIRGTVSLAPSLAKQADPGDSVFIYARSKQGSVMPLAIVRTTVSALPYDYQLDDSVSVMADLKLSQTGEVIVVARISKTGDAKSQKGDLQGLSGAVTPGRDKVDVEINAVLP